jgi:N-glycosylase/DNA lyase
MMTVSPICLERTVAALCPLIQAQLRERSERPLKERELWHQLALCVLSSRVPFSLAAVASRSIVGVIANKNHGDRWVREHLLAILEAPLRLERGQRRYRFPRVRAEQLARTRATVLALYGSLASLHNAISEIDSIAARALLVGELAGIGPKQASMFLRNIWLGERVVIVDSHLVRYCRAVGIAGCEEGARSLRQYEAFERSFISYADKFGHAIESVDIAVWITMQALAQARS